MCWSTCHYPSTPFLLKKDTKHCMLQTLVCQVSSHHVCACTAKTDCSGWKRVFDMLLMLLQRSSTGRQRCTTCLSGMFELCYRLLPVPVLSLTCAFCFALPLPFPSPFPFSVRFPFCTPLLLYLPCHSAPEVNGRRTYAHNLHYAAKLQYALLALLACLLNNARPKYRSSKRYFVTASAPV